MQMWIWLYNGWRIKEESKQSFLSSFPLPFVFHFLFYPLWLFPVLCFSSLLPFFFHPLSVALNSSHFISFCSSFSVLLYTSLSLIPSTFAMSAIASNIHLSLSLLSLHFPNFSMLFPSKQLMVAHSVQVQKTHGIFPFYFPLRISTMGAESKSLRFSFHVIFELANTLKVYENQLVELLQRIYCLTVVNNQNKATNFPALCPFMRFSWP